MNGPYFFKDDADRNVAYHHDDFQLLLSKMQEMGPVDMWIQQEVIPPPRLCDLTSLEYFLWVSLKNSPCTSNVQIRKNFLR